MKMNINELLAQFCQEAALVRNFSPVTVSWYKFSFGFFQKHAKIQYIDEITTENLRAFLYWGRMERKWCADTFLHYYKGLKPFLKWCVERGYREDNPILKIEKPKLEKKLPKRITKQEAHMVLEASFHRKYYYRFERYRNRGLIGTIIYAGLRAGEVMNLKVGDVDLKNNVISVNQGKGGKDRVVPICLQLQRILLEYMQDRERLGRKCPTFFTSVHGDISFTYNGLKKVIQTLKKDTSVHFSAHRLRHTFATLMLEGGCDLFSLQKMMGHSDIKTTTIYLSTTVNHLQEQIKKHPLSIP